MRRLLILSSAILAVAACTKTETPAVDTGTTAMAPEAAPAPAAISEADVVGTWTGTSNAVGGDTTVFKWTQVCGAGKCKGTQEGSKVTINSSYTLAGDSAVGTSEPFSDPKMMKGAKMIDTWVVHIMGANATGTGAMKLASKPDSVVMAYRFTGSKKM